MTPNDYISGLTSRKPTTGCIEGALSSEAKAVLEGMVHYCLDNGVGMGMDEGWIEHTNKRGEPVKTKKRKFRAEIEAAFNYPNSCREEAVK